LLDRLALGGIEAAATIGRAERRVPVLCASERVCIRCPDCACFENHGTAICFKIHCINDGIPNQWE
jgi:hypothetical protein